MGKPRMGVISLKASLSPCLLNSGSFSRYKTQIPRSSKSCFTSAKPWPAHVKPEVADEALVVFHRDPEQGPWLCLHFPR